jgi:putative YhdH/YhfP family quinone oxidoreductase
VVVNGAAGGVASIAIDMLAGCGYSVTAITRTNESSDYLTQLGATEVVQRASLVMGKRPLETALWAGALDSLGGESLAWLTRTMQTDGVIAAFGNAAGQELSTTVLPFILRGVRLIGVNANSAMPLRKEVWARIGGPLKPRHLDTIVKEISLDELPDAFSQLVAGRARGRFVVAMA